jgi:hypothetical protein
MTADSFVRYPLSKRFTMRRSAGRAARRVRLLAGAADWRRDLVDRAGSIAVSAIGTRSLPTAVPWPWPDCSPGAIEDELADALGPVTILAAAAPRQSGRQRLSLLVRRDDVDVVVKLGRPDDGLDVETDALECLTRDPLPGIATPTVLAAGSFTGSGHVSYLVTSAIGLTGQRPAIDEALRTFESDLGERLASLPRPADCPPTWVPTHGDLAPWNLRRTAYGLALFDWESAAWRPPGSDLEHYRETCAGLRRTR